MFFLIRALWVALVGLLLASSAAGAAPLSLQEAIRRTAATHPQLRSFAVRNRQLELERQRAVLAPPMSIGATLENALGSGEYSGLGSAETTFTLAGVLERGDKAAARRALVTRRIDELAVQREVKELDLLAEVARRYLDLAEAQARLPLWMAAVQRQRDLAAAVRRRFAEGASPEALALSAEAELARRESELKGAQQAVEVTWGALALLWADSAPGEAPEVTARSAALPVLQPLQSLRSSIVNLPDLRFFAQAQRVQEAQRALAVAARSFDLEWQLGVRRLEASGDTALLAGVTLPLGARARAELDESIEATQGEMLAQSRDSTRLELEALLLRVHGEIAAALERVRALETAVTPRLETAAAQAGRAYAAGALSYYETLQLQNEVTRVAFEVLALRYEIDRKLVELQRLTGEPIVVATSPNGENP